MRVRIKWNISHIFLAAIRNAGIRPIPLQRTCNVLGCCWRRQPGIQRAIGVIIRDVVRVRSGQGNRVSKQQVREHASKGGVLANTL